MLHPAHADVRFALGRTSGVTFSGDRRCGDPLPYLYAKEVCVVVRVRN